MPLLDVYTVEGILMLLVFAILSAVQSYRVYTLKFALRDLERSRRSAMDYYFEADAKLRRKESAHENLKVKYEKLESNYRRVSAIEREKCRDELYKTVEDYIKRSPFSRSAVFSSIDDYSALIKNPRFQTALTDDTMRLVTVPEISVKVRGQNGDVYDVSLDSCTCMDFQTRHKPCKHMYRLAIFIGALGAVDQSKVDESLNAYYLARDKAAEEIAALKKERALAKQDAEKRLEAARTIS